MTTPEVVNTAIDTEPVQPTPKFNQKRSKLIYLVLLFFVLLLLAGAGVAGYLLTRDSDDNDNDNGNNDQETAQSCTYDGKEYQEGEGFEATDGCNSCGCTDGEVVCTLIACEDLPEGDTNDDSSTDSSSPNSNLVSLDKSKFPIVAYEKEGLISSSEKTRIQKHLLEPLTLYHNESELKILTIMITPSENNSSEYGVDIIFLDGTNTGILWGDTKDWPAKDYWVPSCGQEGEFPCNFSTQFRQRYPQIVNTLEQ